MTTIKGTMSIFPQDRRWGTCVWCQSRTFVWMLTPGRPDLGSVPLHAMCAAEIVAAFDNYKATGKLHPHLARLLEGGPQALTDGVG